MYKIYIAGPISSNGNYINDFKQAEEKLKAKGYAVINPVKNLGFSYKDYIDMGLCELMKCDSIYMLKGWELSIGAKLERHYAITIGMDIIYESLEEANNGLHG